MFRAFLALCLLIIVSHSARADESRYQDYAVGARALGFAGAFTAIADDPSAIFYNVAGLIDAGSAKLSVATSLYGIELVGNSPVESATRRLSSGLTTADFIIIPSNTGFVMGIGAPNTNGAFRHAIGFGTLVPNFQSRFTETVDENEDFRTVFRSRTIDRTLHAGAGYAFRAGPWLRLGAGVHYVLRTLDTEEDILRFEQSAPGDTFLQSNNQLRTSIHSLRATFGLKFRPGPRISIGIHLLTPTLGFYRDGSFSSQSIDGRGAGGPEITRRDVDLKTSLNPTQLSLQSPLPLTLRTGVAFIERGDYTLSADAIFYGASENALISIDELNANPGTIERIPIPLSISRRPIVNFALGGEKYLNKKLLIAGGFFTNFSSAERLKFDDDDNERLAADSTRLSNISTFGGSLSLAFGDESKFSRLGITGSIGRGLAVVPSSANERFGEGSPPLRGEERTETFAYVFWSSTFKWGERSTQRRYGL